MSYRITLANSVRNKVISNIFSRVRCNVTNNNGLWFGWLHLLLTPSSTLSQSQSVTANLLTSQITRTSSILIFELRLTLLQFQVQVTLQLTVSQSVSLGIEHPPGTHDQIFIAPRLLRSCFFWPPSLTRGWVCFLYMLLALASALFLGSSSLETCHHILLSHILDFPFRRLILLAGSRWRYSTLPPHGVWFLTLLSDWLLLQRVGSDHSTENPAPVLLAECTAR
jgi:hypothetical protein